jgi:hypothetical protein
MIINSDFKDYYDLMQKHGVDKLTVYNRRTQEFKYEDKCPALAPLQEKLGELRAWSSRDGGLHWPMFLVGFCGEFHVGFRLDYFDNYTSKSACVYDVEHFSDFLKRVNKDLYARFNMPIKVKGKRTYWRDRIEFQREGAQHAFSYFAKPDIQVFQNIGAPTFLIVDDAPYGNANRFINPRLKDFDFRQVKPPQTAYQELAMFISGVLGQQAHPMVPIGDVDMAAKKGFDKWSFRKHRDDPK